MAESLTHQDTNTTDPPTYCVHNTTRPEGTRTGTDWKCRLVRTYNHNYDLSLTASVDPCVPKSLNADVTCITVQSSTACLPPETPEPQREYTEPLCGNNRCIPRTKTVQHPMPLPARVATWVQIFLRQKPEVSIAEA